MSPILGFVQWVIRVLVYSKRIWAWDSHLEEWEVWIAVQRWKTNRSVKGCKLYITEGLLMLVVLFLVVWKWVWVVVWGEKWSGGEIERSSENWILSSTRGTSQCKRGGVKELWGRVNWLNFLKQKSTSQYYTRSRKCINKALFKVPVDFFASARHAAMQKLEVIRIICKLTVLRVVTHSFSLPCGSLKPFHGSSIPLFRSYGVIFHHQNILCFHIPTPL